MNLAKGIIEVTKKLGTRIVAGNAVPLHIRGKREILNIVEAISTQINGI